MPLDKLVELPAETLAFENVIDSAGASRPDPVAFCRSQYRRNEPQAALALAEALAALERFGLLLDPTKGRSPTAGSAAVAATSLR
ncbi:hypothetical protein Q5424_17475 [Conexibacter sp. JD483]|uniref:hypothetical protein n=1 Tax=unclassified Conexibacter TaxID=2627773 RepID=UPI0027256E6C|nr:MULTISPECIES: hypothetical protein [unclassified Conexibacter]MDO8186464.1 hypothetical protein [Conexibacter sp. CPCC 205706]MDO8200033.1 hypothetical protein [Conexibacter sp. CPCC 205762]MDR9370891.1 hypothetical protein [Conexibacter sp. JD483]